MFMIITKTAQIQTKILKKMFFNISLAEEKAVSLHSSDRSEQSERPSATFDVGMNKGVLLWQ